MNIEDEAIRVKELLGDLIDMDNEVPDGTGTWEHILSVCTGNFPIFSSDEDLQAQIHGMRLYLEELEEFELLVQLRDNHLKFWQCKDQDVK